MTAPQIEKLSDGVTLYRGDCREILPTLGGVDAVVTDPPYGIDAARKRGSQKHGWADHGIDGWDKIRASDEIIKAILARGVPTVIWGGNYYIDLLRPATKWLIWDKCQRDFSLADAELAWCSFQGAVRRISLSRSVALLDKKQHPTQKSIEVMKWCIEQLPSDARSVLDPFMGSGTTGVAAVNLGRKFTGIEIEPKYFDVACRRIADELARPRLFAEPAPMPKQEAFL